jgi:hypothetical protein
MAHIKLKTPVPATASPIAAAPFADSTAFYPPEAEDVSSSPLQPLDVAGLADMGAEGDTTAEQPTAALVVAQTVIAAPAPQPPTHDPRVDALSQRISGVAEAAKSDIDFLRAEVVKTLHDNVHPRIEEAEAQLKRIAAVAGKSDKVDAVVKRLDALDAMLASSGLQTSTTAALPQLRLRRYPATRHIIRPPEVAADGNSVILFYNPKPAGPGENGEMVELNITTAGRRIATGYTIDVPDGYVCDVVVNSDVVASVQGRGEAELTVTLTSRGPARHVGATHEICKLTLRRMEKLSLKVD